MNILYCGDRYIIDGLVISILSLLKNTNENLYVYVFTMDYEDVLKKYDPITKKDIDILDKLVKEKNKKNFVKLIDLTKIASNNLPIANLDTRFTPYCMLRLYADLVKGMPSKILYLDNDIVALKDPVELYNMDNKDFELVGVLDRYGSHLFKTKIIRKTYVNSGVLLMNLDLIKETGLFEKAREKCKKTKMLLPDQTALNICARKKLIIDKKYNEQKKIYPETVFRHYTTTFKFWPKYHTQTIKPWNIEKLHDVLKDHEFDDILEKYNIIIKEFKNE